jgi:hypothetical protein
MFLTFLQQGTTFQLLRFCSSQRREQAVGCPKQPAQMGSGSTYERGVDLGERDHDKGTKGEARRKNDQWNRLEVGNNQRQKKSFCRFSGWDH